MSETELYRVVLVDDEPWVLEDIDKAINWDEIGYKICAKLQSAEELLCLYRRIRPHVIISDIKMSGMSGIELLNEVNNIYKNEVVFILLSIYDLFSYATQAVRYDAFDYLLKPVDGNALKEVLLRAKERLQLLYGTSIDYNGYKIVDDVMSYIKENYPEYFSLNDMASSMHLNPSYLSKAFKQKTGVNISKCLTEYRINAAIDLLKNTRLSLDEIAFKVGYSDYFYFNKIFKKEKGITPSAFRREMEIKARNCDSPV